MEFLGLLFHDRGRRSTRGSGAKNRSAGQLLLANGFVSLQRENEIGSDGCVVRRAEDFVFVSLKYSDPGIDVSGVLLGIMRYATLRSQKYAGEFRSKLLLRIVR